MTDVVRIDGSMGEGGGQIVRSSLALSAVTQQVVEINCIRGGRRKPGLLRQHLAGLRAMTQICDAEMVGDHLGSSSFRFHPGPPRGGRYRFEVGSAGSAILVAQTILPALMFADQSSEVEIVGGTHASWAPPFDYFDRCYLPLLRRMGGRVEASIDSLGFYPAGGGAIRLRIDPSPRLGGLELINRVGDLRQRVMAMVAGVPTSVARRECDHIQRKTKWDDSVFEQIEVKNSGGSGNVVMIEHRFENLCEIVTAYGKVGVRAEQVAETALRLSTAYMSADAPVSEHMADQMLLIAAIAAGTGSGAMSRFRTIGLSSHSQTQIKLIPAFLPIHTVVDSNADGTNTIAVTPR